MSLLVCAITTPRTSEPEGALERLAVGNLTVWFTRVKVHGDGFRREDVLAHHRLVADVFERVEACLPARFPTLVDDEAALRQHVEKQQTELTEQLQAVRGACELAITAVWTTPEEAPGGLDALTPGRRYMEVRRVSEHRRERARQLAAALETSAGSALRETVRHLCPSNAVALSLALLLERSAGPDVRERIQRQPLDDVRILVNGPWPPYTFVDRRPRSTPS